MNICRRNYGGPRHEKVKIVEEAAPQEFVPKKLSNEAETVRIKVLDVKV